MSENILEQGESLADAVVETIQRAKASVNTGEQWTVTLPFDDWSKIVRLAEGIRGSGRLMSQTESDLTCTCPWCRAPMKLRERGADLTWVCTECVGRATADLADIEAAVYRRDHGIALG